MAEGTPATRKRRSLEALRRVEGVLDEGEPWLTEPAAKAQVAAARCRARRAMVAVTLLAAADGVLAGGVHDHCGALGLDGSVWKADEAERRRQAQEGREAALYALDVSAYAPEDAPPLSVEQQERIESAQRRVQEAAAALESGAVQRAMVSMESLERPIRSYSDHVRQRDRDRGREREQAEEGAQAAEAALEAWTAREEAAEAREVREREIRERHRVAFVQMRRERGGDHGRSAEGAHGQVTRKNAARKRKRAAAAAVARQ